jgi:hypothetical protein
LKAGLPAVPGCYIIATTEDTPELTINYGLRYEYISPPTAQELDHVYGFDFKTGKQLLPILKQTRPSIIEPDYKDFAPRLGLAYNPQWGVRDMKVMKGR